LIHKKVPCPLKSSEEIIFDFRLSGVKAFGLFLSSENPSNPRK
jgi:hypothetical protein